MISDVVISIASVLFALLVVNMGNTVEHPWQIIHICFAKSLAGSQTALTAEPLFHMLRKY